VLCCLLMGASGQWVRVVFELGRGGSFLSLWGLGLGGRGAAAAGFQFSQVRYSGTSRGLTGTGCCARRISVARCPEGKDDKYRLAALLVSDEGSFRTKIGGAVIVL
jgi:hypothetical protein